MGMHDLLKTTLKNSDDSTSALMYSPGRLLVYLITGPTGLQYVGIVYGKNQTVAGRWGQHCNPKVNAKHRRLERAVAEYGSDAFTIEVIDEVYNLSVLGAKEQFYIKSFGTYPNGYNGNFGKWNGIPTNLHTEDSKRKIREHTKIALSDPSVRLRMSLSHKGTVMPKETKDKIAKSHEGIRPSKSTRNKLSAIAQCRVYTRETREKMRQSRIGIKDSEETRRRKSVAAKTAHQRRKFESQGAV